MDGHETGRELLTQQMAVWKMACDAVATGNEALVALHREATAGRPYSVAVMDAESLGTSTAEFAATLAKDPLLSRTRLVWLVHYAYRANESLGSGADSTYARKPVRQSLLWEAMGRVLTGPAPQAVSPKAPATTVEPKYFRILLAEDNVPNQKVAIHFLRKLGYTADVVSNGAEALETTARAPYDLILMDCHMPVMDGYEAAARLREREGHSRRTVIVAMTANALQGDRDACFAAGMDDYLTKPVDLSNLKTVLETWLKPAAQNSSH